MACTHGLFAAGALERIGAQPDVVEIVCTNTVPVPAEHAKPTVLSIAPALAQAVQRIHDGGSVSALFDAVRVPCSRPASRAAAGRDDRSRRPGRDGGCGGVAGATGRSGGGSAPRGGP
ncbi:MAG: ribose-phosphate pyrophosphokinae [Modestobacter sp.]|nr:ribose-phosphate pyrophosphokinae [Modestobacter sp.]